MNFKHSTLIIDRVSNGFTIIPPLRGDHSNRLDQLVFGNSEALVRFVREWAVNWEVSDEATPAATKTCPHLRTETIASGASRCLICRKVFDDGKDC